MLSSAGGGLYNNVLLSTTGAGGPYGTLSPAQIADIENYTGMDVSSGGFTVSGQKANGWGFRAFGGVSLDLFILSIDALGMYNISSKTFGASVNARIQL